MSSDVAVQLWPASVETKMPLGAGVPPGDAPVALTENARVGSDGSKAASTMIMSVTPVGEDQSQPSGE